MTYFNLPETTIIENEYARLYDTPWGYYVEHKTFKFSNGQNRHFPAMDRNKAGILFLSITGMGMRNLSPVHRILTNTP